MTESKGAATRKGGGSSAAKAERNGKPKMFKWEGVELLTPVTLPPTLGLELGRMQALEDAGQSSMGAAYALVEKLIGSEGIAAVAGALESRPALQKKYPGLQSGLYVDLIAEAVVAHGTTVGESSASATS